jgi:hypothetical protein
MDRNIVYPGAIPLDSDLLSLNRNTMIAFGYLAQLVLGTSTVVDGLSCSPTVPASLSVIVGPGSITQLSVVDALAYGSLAADSTDPLVKMGINLASASFTVTPPTASGQSANYLIEAALQEADGTPVVMPYYNAANPSQPYSGPTNSGVAQNTLRTQRVQLQLKAGAAATAGTQVTPPVDEGWVGLYVITVSYGQTAITGASISLLVGAPFLGWKLPVLRPGFASGVQSIASSGNFIVPVGVTQIEVEIWGAGSGSYASVASLPSGGGSGGGYARKRITGLNPGQVIPVIVGAGGSAGSTSTPAGAGGSTSFGSTSFGSYVSATGGGLNPLATVASPWLGASAGGFGVGGDINIAGGWGTNGINNIGGAGGAGAMGGGATVVATSFANAGQSPGGGASGAGTGLGGNTAQAGAAGASGLVMVRW